MNSPVFRSKRYLNLYFSIILVLITVACREKMEDPWQNRRPNIIFLLTDDQRDNTLAAWGHPFVQTPNLDRLVAQSVRFGNTYIAEPVCAPSRVSLLTGMHERKHGVGFSSSYQLTEEQWSKSYPALLRENGYYTGFVGKFGVEYYTFRGRAAEKFDFWRGHDGWTRFFPKQWDTESCMPYHDAGPDIITPIMGESIDMFLDSIPDDRPFCLSVSFNVPHGSQTTSMYTDYDDWRGMTRPANENPKLKGSPFYDSLYRNTDFAIPDACCTDPYQHIPRDVLDQQDGRANRTYTYSYDPETCREHHIRYYQTISGLDHTLGNMLESLEKRGLKESTIIIYASDHGLLMGEYGMGGKALLYDLTSKIPCFIFDPALSENLRGRTLDSLVSSLDIPSTILDYAGIEQPGVMDGQSLAPLVYGKEIPWRDEIFLESLFTLRGNPYCEGVRRGDWKYIRMFASGKPPYTEEDIHFKDRKPDFEQLFNLAEDPGEVRNLIGKYQDSEILQELRQKCARYSEELNHDRAAFRDHHRVVRR